MVMDADHDDSGAGVEVAGEHEGTHISRLPDDAMFCIIDKLFELVDYVNFASVCKGWHSVAKDYNHIMQRWRRQSKGRLLPMLMLPRHECQRHCITAVYHQEGYYYLERSHRMLYSVSERKIHNINIRLPVHYFETFCGSSHGWLASEFKVLPQSAELPGHIKIIHQITIRNPFVPKDMPDEVIQFPSYTYVVENFEYYRTKDWIPNVILSADPILHPDNYYALLAFYRPLIGRDEAYYAPFICLIKGGQEDDWIEIPFSHPFDDAIFYKDKVILLLAESDHCLATFDIKSSSDLPPPQAKNIMLTRSSDSYIDLDHMEQYLVESTNGDLCIVQMFYTEERIKSFEVYKVVFNAVFQDDSAEMVKMKSIGDEAIFLGQSQSLSVLASEVPGCLPNSIYYATEYAIRSDEEEYEYKNELGIFNLRDGTTTPLIDDFENWNDKSGPFWILPSLDSSS